MLFRKLVKGDLIELIDANGRRRCIELQDVSEITGSATFMESTSSSWHHFTLCHGNRTTIGADDEFAAPVTVLNKRGGQNGGGARIGLLADRSVTITFRSAAKAVAP